jgi:hypothetical protein
MTARGTLLPQAFGLMTKHLSFDTPASSSGAPRLVLETPRQRFRKLRGIFDRCFFAQND